MRRKHLGAVQVVGYHAGFAVVTLIVLMCLSLWLYPPGPVLELQESEVITPVVEPGGHLIVRRQFTAFRSVTLESTRFIRNLETGAEYHMEGSRRSYEPGTYNRNNALDVPDNLPDGVYELHTSHRYATGPWVTSQAEWTPVRFIVRDRP